MSIPPGRNAPNPLAQVRLQLSAGVARRGWIVGCALVVAALLAGAAAGPLLWGLRGDSEPERDGLRPQLLSVQRALEQSRLQLRASDARGRELERQIDALNQRLRECVEELTFFRKTRDGKP